MSDDPRVLEGEDRTTLSLPPRLGVAEADGLRTACQQAVEIGLPVTVDGSAVERMHTAALQCLLAFSLRLEEQGSPVEWMGASPALSDQLVTLGLDPWVGHDPAEA